MGDPLPPDVQAAREALDEGRAWQARERERRIGAYYKVVGATVFALGALFAPFSFEPLWRGRGLGGLRLGLMVAGALLVLGVALWQRRRLFRRLGVEPDALWGVPAGARWSVVLLTVVSVAVAVEASRPDLVTSLALGGGALLLALQAARSRDAAHAGLALALGAVAIMLAFVRGSSWPVVAALLAFGLAMALTGRRRARSPA